MACAWYLVSLSARTSSRANASPSFGLTLSDGSESTNEATSAAVSSPLWVKYRTNCSRLTAMGACSQPILGGNTPDYNPPLGRNNLYPAGVDRRCRRA